MGNMAENRGEYRYQRAPEGVAHHHGPVGQALGLCGENVVLSQGLQAGGSGLLDQFPQAAETHHPRRQNQVAEQVGQGGKASGGVHAVGRQPAQCHRKEGNAGQT